MSKLEEKRKKATKKKIFKTYNNKPTCYIFNWKKKRNEINKKKKIRRKLC